MAAGKDYVWAVDAGTDGADHVLFAQLLTVVDGCVVPEPTRRLTVPRVLESLTTLQRDVGAAAPAASGGVSAIYASSGSVAESETLAPPTGVPGTPVYDVVAIVGALEALSIDAGAVVDAIGGMSASSLDALRAAGLPYVKCLAVKKALADARPVTGPVKVGDDCCTLVLRTTWWGVSMA